MLAQKTYVLSRTGGTRRNSFFSVDVGGSPITKVTGQSNKVLSDGTGASNALTNNNPQPGSVAVVTPGMTEQSIPAALAGSYTYYFGQRILLVDPNGNNDPNGLRSVQDQCPACSDSSWLTNGAVNHMDVYNSSPACGPRSFGDYQSGNTFFTINLR